MSSSAFRALASSDASCLTRSGGAPGAGPVDRVDDSAGRRETHITRAWRQMAVRARQVALGALEILSPGDSRSWQRSVKSGFSEPPDFIRT